MIILDQIIEQMGNRIPIIVGPTGIGKTSFAIELAKKIDAEIISVDSRQIYKGFRIGTAQPSDEERSTITHHLIDMISPNQVMSAGDYVDITNKTISQIQSKGKNIILVGGSLMYVKSISEGIVDTVDTDDNIREEIEKRIQSEGVEVLMNEMKNIDPEYSKILHKNDIKRLVRAFEIYKQTGMSPTELFRKQKNRDQQIRNKYFIIELKMDREKLYNRIDKRVELMIIEGWLDEIKLLLNAGVSKSCHAMQSVGYKQLINVIDNEDEIEDTVESIKQKTRQFAKKQLTWLNKMNIDYTINIEKEEKNEVKC
jgi:tRNA dimethylallyltransferase